MRAFLTGRSARVVLALGLAAYLLWYSDPSAVRSAAANARWSWLAAAVGLVIVDRALSAARWIALLDDAPAAPRPPIPRLLRIFFVSTFIGWFTPAALGGDVLRVWGLSRERVGGAQAAASVAMDRLLGVIGLVLLATAGLILGHSLIGDSALVVALATAATGCAAGVALVYSRRTESWLQAVARLLPGTMAALSSKLLTAVRAYSTRHAAVTSVLVLSLAVNVVRVFETWTIGQAIGIEADLRVYFAFVPIAMIVMLLPINFGALGPGQGVLVLLFARAGVPEAQTFVLTVLFAGLSVVGNLPGGILYAFGSERRTAAHL